MASPVDAPDVLPPRGTTTSAASADREIAAIALRQHGVIEYRQLIRLGLSPKAIAHRVETGRLHRIHRGVYAVGHAKLSGRGQWMAAVLAAGDDAALSHRSAASLWGLPVPASSLIDVTAPKDRRRPGIAIHEAVLLPDEHTSRDGIPVTTVARTILDLAATEPRHVERALREAERRRLADTTPLAALLTRYPGRRGTARIREILDAGHAHLGITRSELEEAFLAFLDAHHFIRPLLNAHVEGFECDCVWPAERVVVELDGRAFHDNDSSYESDRRRDRALQAAGLRTIRVTWESLHQDTANLERDLSALVPRRRL